MIPEFSRVTRADMLKGGARTLELVADEAERQALARRFGVLAVDSLVARLEVRPFRAVGLGARGEVRARLSQTCSVTLETIATDVVEPIDARFLPESMIEPEAEDLALDPDAPDPPEPLVDNAVDLGELAAQHVALGIDPFPRKRDAILDFTPDPEEERPSPFAVLRFPK